MEIFDTKATKNFLRVLIPGSQHIFIPKSWLKIAGVPTLRAIILILWPGLKIWISEEKFLGTKRKLGGGQYFSAQR